MGKEERRMGVQTKDKNLAKKVTKIRKIKSAKMKAQKLMVRQANQELVGKHAVVKRKRVRRMARTVKAKHQKRVKPLRQVREAN